MNKSFLSLIVMAWLCGLLLAGAQSSSNRVENIAIDETLPLIIGANPIITDVAKSLGYRFFRFKSFVPAGQDPHSFEPTPKDIAGLENATLVFINGLGLEGHLMSYFESLPEEKVIDLSENISPRFRETSDEHHTHHGHAHKEKDTHESKEADPHVWGDPNNVKIWATSIAKQLIQLAPEEEDEIIHRSYRTRYKMSSLLSRMKALVFNVPDQNRVLATDHDVLGYFAELYGFRTEIVVHPSFSSVGQPSAREVAKLIDQIKELNVPALFVSSTVPSKLCSQIAEETGIKVIPLSFETLENDRQFYEEMMYDVAEKIVQALR